MRPPSDFAIRTVVAPFLVLLFALLLTVGQSPPCAFGCTCIGAPAPIVALGSADVVFSGVVTRAVDPEGRGTTISSGRRVYYTFAVDDVWKGPAADSITVHTAASSVSCGYEFEIGTVYLVYARADSTGLRTGRCTRTRPATEGREDLQAFAALGEKGDAERVDRAIVARFIAQAESPDSTARSVALHALRDVGGKMPGMTLPALKEVYGHGSTRIREDVLAAAGGLPKGFPDALPLLREAMRDTTYTVRRAAIDSASWLGYSEEILAPMLQEALRDPSAEVRATAAIACRTPALETLLFAALHDSSAQVRMLAASGLGDDPGMHEEIREALMAALGDPAPEVRARAAYSLGRLKDRYETTQRALIAMLADSSSSARDCAARALAEPGPLLDETSSALEPLLHDPDENAAMDAADALVHLAPLTPVAYEGLLEGYRVGSARLRERVIGGLPTDTLHVATIVPLLITATEDSDEAVRGWALTKLAKLGRAFVPNLVDLLIRSLRDPDWRVRSNAAGRLGNIGPAAAAAIPDLERARDDPTTGLRREAASALGKIRGH